MIPSIPANESDRLAALYGYQVLDTAPEEAFDDLVRLAAELCQTPLALITLVDAKRQWFKARIGTRVTQTSRDVSFCAHAILDSKVMVVPDTRLDPRLAENPDVTAGPRYRFYAGAPLITREGFALGTLCVLDVKPRELSEAQIGSLEALSRQVVSQLELRRLLAESRANAMELTEAKRTAEREGQAAAAASRAKSMFLANMSHELRTPLNSIIGYSEMMEEDAAAQGQTQTVSDLKKILMAGRHLLRLINDILDFSKIEAGKATVFVESFDVCAMAEDVVETIRPLVERHGNRLELICPSDIGSMESDLTKIRQCLFNLLGNAGKFTENGHVSLQISRRLRQEQFWIEMQIIDTGIGINEEQLSRLFTAFSQADPATQRRFGGTGLGLAISRQFSWLMGGDISVQSHEGSGSTFTISLPAKCPQEEPALASEKTFPVSLAGKESSVVLVIDDEDSARELMVRHLQREGFTPVAASSGAEGLRVAREIKPAAITLDVVMPQMDGWAVLSALKGDPEMAEIPVIMLSMIDDRGMGFALGAADYLVKPIGRGQLAELLEPYKTEKADLPVLVVEDDDDTRNMLRRTLQLDGWSVMSAEDGQAALRCVAERRPAMILLDLMMPRMNGFEFIAELRKTESWRSIPIVVVTARHLTADDKSKLDGAVYKILQKVASSRDELMNSVSELMNRRIKK
jgi:signal transduction histidine kinase/CheY-like chemotaxis protein